MSIRTTLSIAFLSALSAAAAPGSGQAAQARRALEWAPVRFEQTAPTEYVARGLGYQMVLGPAGAMVSTTSSTVQIAFPGANASARMEGLDRSATRTDYFRGADRSQWRTGVPTYQRVRCAGIYPGIDLVYYASGGRLEYDFIVAPGADPHRIRVQFLGADETRVSRDGDLVVRSGGETLVQRKPALYQRGAETAVVRGSYRMARNGMVGFSVGAYDRSRPLVIDPVLTYTSYLSGNGGDFLTLLAADSNGFLYVAGYTTGANITTVGSPVTDTPPGDKDIFVAKLDPTKFGDESVLYATYLGGSGADIAKAMTVDPDGVILLTGSTTSTDFPATSGALGKSLTALTDAFFVRLSTTDGLLYSTYHGSALDDSGEAIAYDGVGRAFVAGNTTSTDFPVTSGAMQKTNGGKRDAFLTVYETYSDGSTLPIYTTYYGGEGSDTVRSVAIDRDGGAWIAGYTTSNSLPLAGDSFCTANAGFGDVFVAKLLLPQGDQPGSLAYATYLGGSSLDDVSRVLVDSAGGVIVTGYTLSNDFPLSADALQTKRRGNSDIFVARLDPSQPAASQLTYSTLLGGAGADVPYDAVLDGQNTLYLTGYTTSPDFPLAGNPYQQTWAGLTDAFVVRLDLSKGPQALLYSTYLGSHSFDTGYGVELLADGKIAVAGVTASMTFPADNPIQRAQTNGAWGSFVVVLDPK